MRISIVGTGYVGLSTGVGFAKMGNNVVCMDIDKGKVDAVNAGRPPIYEPGMESLLKNAIDKGSLRATTDLDDAVMNSEITFISVPTPQRNDGSSDMGYIEKASDAIGHALKAKKAYHVVVVKSTVVPGTTEGVVLPALEKASGKKAGKDFGLCMNPEFLREGRALGDFLKPDRIVIGSLDARAGNAVEGLYSGFDSPVLRTDLKTAEMIKYASNALLATKISFSNEIGNICKGLGIDAYEVMGGVGMDSRISPHFLQAGAGFGGSCFPKDVAAVAAKGRELGKETKILDSVLETNRAQRKCVVDLIEQKVGGLSGKNVAVLGLAFKPNSDDIRESPSIDIISMLKGCGAEVSAYDPQAMENMKAIHPDIEYCKTPGDCLRGADLCLILTDWDEFKDLSEKDFDVMNSRVIIEGRKVLNPKSVKCFEGLCWPGNADKQKN